MLNERLGNGKKRDQPQILSPEFFLYPRSVNDQARYFKFLHGSTNTYRGRAMKDLMFGLFLSTLIAPSPYAQQSPAPPTETIQTAASLGSNLTVLDRLLLLLE